MKNLRQLIGLLAGSVTAILISDASFAQTASEATGPAAAEPSVGLEEIVVTAQKRKENAQDVPLAVTAISAGALQAQGITDVAGIAGDAPNVTLKSTASFGGSSSILVAYIRGIGQNDFAFNLEPGVGVYIDGVYLARNIGANVDLLDLDRVEVLKGPQGTLFGRNTMGGAVDIVTRDPGQEFKYKAEATTGSFSRHDFRGTVDLPIIPNVLTSGVSLSTEHRVGWQRRIPYTGDTADNPILLAGTGGAFGGGPNTNTDAANLYPVVHGTQEANRSGDQDQTTVRAKLLWTPTDKLKVRLITDYLYVDEEAPPFSLLQVNQAAYVAIYNTCITGNQAVIGAVTAQTGFPGIPALCNNPRGNPGSPTGVQPSLASQAGANLPYDGRYVIPGKYSGVDPDLSYASGANFNHINNYGINGQIEYELMPDMEIKSITGFRHLNSAFGVDIGGAPFSALNPTFADRERQLSEELQLLGKWLDNRWNYVIGAYYFNESGSHDDGVPFTGGLIQIWSPNATYDTKSYAAYTHNNFTVIPDLLSITAGVRYTKEKKQFTGAQADENAFGYQLLQLPNSVLPDPTDPYRIYPLGKNYLEFSNTSYRVGPELHVTKDVMLYASYATAFKGGGWTTRLTLPNFSVNPATGALTPLPAPTFAPETAKTAEIGVKSELFDHRIRLNAAIFDTQYDNIQLTFQNGPSPVTANGGNGRIKGAELELNAGLIRDWTLDASVGYLDAKYTQVAAGVDLTVNDQFVNTPKWNGALGTEYRIRFPFGSFAPRLDWTYASKTYNDEANTELLATPAHGFINTSLTYRTESERFEVQAGITNLADKRVVVSGYTNAEAIYSGTFSPPREWFLTFRIKN